MYHKVSKYQDNIYMENILIHYHIYMPVSNLLKSNLSQPQFDKFYIKSQK